MKEHTMELFANYPYMNQVIIDHKLEEYLDRIKWHTFENDAIIAEHFQNVVDTFEKLTSSNIPLVLEGKTQALTDYQAIGSKLHVFSREQARHELNLSNDNVAEIFSRIEIGGAKYCTPDKPQLLF